MDLARAQRFNDGRPRNASGQTRTSADVCEKTASPPKADMPGSPSDVAQVPIAAVASLTTPDLSLAFNADSRSAWREPMPEKVAVVTGCSAGIGRSIAVALAKKSYTVVGNSRREDDRANSLLSELHQHSTQSM